MAASTLSIHVFAVKLPSDERCSDMKRVQFIAAAVAGSFCAAGTSTAAIPPAGVLCAGMICANSTSAPQIVDGRAVCATGTSLPVNALLEPLSTRRLNATCPDGTPPLGLSF